MVVEVVDEVVVLEVVVVDVVLVRVEVVEVIEVVVVTVDVVEVVEEVVEVVVVVRMKLTVTLCELKVPNDACTITFTTGSVPWELPMFAYTIPSLSVSATLGLKTAYDWLLSAVKLTVAPLSGYPYKSTFAVS